MGLVVNQSVDDMRFADILEELKLGDKDELIRLPDTIRNRQVLRGGPVQKSRGFVLHSSDWRPLGEGTMQVPGGLEMTATINVLEALAAGGGPGKALLALGYSGWGPGQLEDEILANGWLTCEAAPDLVFSSRDGEKWSGALKSIGVDSLTLSSAAGRA